MKVFFNKYKYIIIAILVVGAIATVGFLSKDVILSVTNIDVKGKADGVNSNNNDLNNGNLIIDNNEENDDIEEPNIEEQENQEITPEQQPIEENSHPIGNKKNTTTTTVSSNNTTTTTTEIVYDTTKPYKLTFDPAGGDLYLYKYYGGGRYMKSDPNAYYFEVYNNKTYSSARKYQFIANRAFDQHINIGVNMPKAVKSGYVFDGWYTGQNGTGEKITYNSIVKTTTDFSLYANYLEPVKFNYQTICDTECDGNKENKSSSVGKGYSIKQWESMNNNHFGIFCKSGYELKGVYKDEELTQQLQYDYVINEGDTLYLKFEAITHKINVKVVGNIYENDELKSTIDGGGTVNLKSDTVKTNETYELTIESDEGFVAKNVQKCYGKFTDCSASSGELKDNIYINKASYSDSSDIYIVVILEKRL